MWFRSQLFKPSGECRGKGKKAHLTSLSLYVSIFLLECNNGWSPKKPCSAGPCHMPCWSCIHCLPSPYNITPGSSPGPQHISVLRSLAGPQGSIQLMMVSSPSWPWHHMGHQTIRANWVDNQVSAPAQETWYHYRPQGPCPPEAFPSWVYQL